MCILWAEVKCEKNNERSNNVKQENTVFDDSTLVFIFRYADFRMIILLFIYSLTSYSHFTVAIMAHHL